MNGLEILKRTGLVFPARDLEVVETDGSVTFELPVEIVSEANQREHWAAKYRRLKRQKSVAKTLTMKHRQNFGGRFTPTMASAC